MYSLPIWAMYFNPSDFPGQTMARMFLNEKPTDQVLVADLDALRERFESMGLVQVSRFPEDDPKIVETWL